MGKEIAVPLRFLLRQLANVLTALDDEQYTTRIALLSDASLGQHVRHIIEFLVELFRGYDCGNVNYDLRERNKHIETDRNLAVVLLKSISRQFDKDNKFLKLTVSLNMVKEVQYEIATNFERELVYNLEHIVHHMALIRIGLRQVSDLPLPESFGVASSTMRHRSSGNRQSLNVQP